MTRLYVKGDPAKRFWARVQKKGANDCWPWAGATDSLGYGRIKLDNRARSVLVHRFSWHLAFGKWPADCLLHRCDNPTCVNPRHLFEGSRKDNVDDMIAKGRMPRGAKRGHAKLTDEKVKRILLFIAAGRSCTSIAKRYSVARNVIRGIKSGTRWKHVPR